MPRELEQAYDHLRHLEQIGDTESARLLASAIKRYHGGDTDAVEKRQVSQNSVPEHTGTPQGQDLPAHEAQVWEEESRYPSGSDSVADGPQTEEKIARRQARRSRRSRFR